MADHIPTAGVHHFAARHVTHSEIRDLGEAFGIYILIFRDPDNIQLELSAPRGTA